MQYVKCSHYGIHILIFASHIVCVLRGNACVGAPRAWTSHVPGRRPRVCSVTAVPHANGERATDARLLKSLQFRPTTWDMPDDTH